MHRTGGVERREPDRLPQLMEREDSEGSGSSSDENDISPSNYDPETTVDEDSAALMRFTPGSTLDSNSPVAKRRNYPSWNSNSSRRGSFAGVDGTYDNSAKAPANGSANPRQQRPTAPARTPSNTYAPPRRPPQHISIHSSRPRSTSASRRRRDPNAQYRAQEKTYIQRVTQIPVEYFGDGAFTPGLGHSTDSETEDESPSSEFPLDRDGHGQEPQLFLGTDDAEPTAEELQIPENRERLEWHSMLASVLKGDVVKQEKQRLIGTIEQKGDRKNEIWIGVRAKRCGRPVAAQRRLVEDGRTNIGPTVEEIIAFQIKGETEVGKPPAKQVQDIVSKIERCESLYPSRMALETANARAASAQFKASCDAVIAWHNTTELINTELAILRGWVGNDELNFDIPKPRPATGIGLSDDSSFLERILKEDGMKSLQGDHSMLLGVAKVIKKAKSSLIENAEAFAQRHLPPYIEELLTLINFPSRLIQEIIRLRLKYAKKKKDPTQKDANQVSTLMTEQHISQFQILLRLAVRIKNEYNIISQPEPGWDLPPCIDDNFDLVVLDALKFYFHMLGVKLASNKNTFKEAEILEQEWEFSNEIGQFLDGGDVEVAEQFSGLTARSLQRLTSYFDRELQRRPEENAADMDKRYKQILDSVRVRQRKLFRFSRLLGQRFENATEYRLSTEGDQLQSFYNSLMRSGHVLVKSPTLDKGIFLIGSPTLFDRPRDLVSILGTSFHADDTLEDASNPYVLIIRSDRSIFWDGKRMEVEVRPTSIDIQPGRLRLVANGSEARLGNARLALVQATGVQLDVLVEQRANLPRVSTELARIKKTASKLSNTIMDSVERIREQTQGLGCQELIQTCFAFATEFGKRSLMYMDTNARQLNNLKLTRLALDWVSFICDDCIAADRKTFRWAVVALEFAMVMTAGQHILQITEEEYARLRTKVAGCMSLLISHFDIMGAKSTLAAHAEKERIEALGGQFRKFDINKFQNDEESSRFVQEQRLAQLAELDEARTQKEAERQALGRVLQDSNEADRSLTSLSASATNVTIRWQQGQYVGGGTFGSVYAAINLDTGYLMAVKEIRLQDPQLIPMIAQQIRDEMSVLQVLDHPNIVSYHGIEVHRDKVYIFMDYCSGGSLATLLEHGRIEDETVVMVYTLQMLEGLAYLHASGIVHRDIKPENILLDHNGVIKYVDFGAAKVIMRQGKTMAAEVGGARGGKQKSMTGTPMYMSPEVIKGGSEGRNGAIDIWSLGCVVLEMATGRRPWASLDNEWAIMYNIAQGNPPQLPTRDQLSDSGIDFVKRCFERDPAKRSSAAELLQHEWIMTIRNQVVIGEPSTPSDAGGGVTPAGSSANSRHSSMSFA